jgi:hypothetical protein
MPVTIIESQVQSPVQSKVDVMKKLNIIITSLESYDKSFMIHEFTTQQCEEFNEE